MAGDVWANVYGFNTGNVRKALYGSILVRDYNFDTTDLSAFTPFETDGTWLSGLMVQDGGTWYNLGAGQSDGPKFSRNLDVSKTPIWQSRQPARSDVTKDEGQVMFGLAEQTHISDCLEFDLALGDATGGSQGEAAYKITKPNELEGRERQVLAIGVDKNRNYFADVFPRVSLNKIDDVEWNPDKPIVLAITWDVFIDPESGFSHRRFREGTGWRESVDDPS